MRIIDADDLKESFRWSEVCRLSIKEIIDIIDNAPTAFDDKALEDRPTGHWIVDKEHSITMTFYKCTNCDWFGGATYFRYCPNCGAYMRKEADNDQ